MSDEVQVRCELCGEPLPAGEEMFNYHGYSCPCPKPPLLKKKDNAQANTLYPHLEADFLNAMNEIGEYGATKHGANAFQARRVRGEGRGEYDRLQTPLLLKHGKEHFNAYERGEAHDHFNDLEHQLAAAAFNAMMEYYCFKKEKECNSSNLKSST